MYEIYGIVNDINRKVYIGQTKQGYEKRFKQHLCPADGSPLLRNAIQKYGKQHFSCELIDIAPSQTVADEKEKMWIFLLKSYVPKYGYNLSMGGKIGHFNSETLKKMSEAKQGERNSFFGKHHTEKSKLMMSIWKKKHYKMENHPRAKKIRCVETGIIYNCIKEAANKTGANEHHIGQIANGQYGRKTSGGYRWEWVNE